jgi:peptidyl-dipeptidase Dcp
MKTHVLAALLATAAPIALAGCATTTTQSATGGAAYRTAQNDVANLTAQANQNVLLAPWTGDYGGVPPWDHADPALVPADERLRNRRAVVAPGQGGNRDVGRARFCGR